MKQHRNRQPTKSHKTILVREAVAVFNNEDDLETTVKELQTHGFASQSLSVIADAKAIKNKLGHVYKSVENEKDNPNLPRTAFVPIETFRVAEGALIGVPLYIAATTATAIVVASGGTLLSAIIAAASAGGAGAILGAIIAKILDYNHAQYIEKQIEQGGILLWVNLADSKHEKLALTILNKRSSDKVYVHDIAA